jgi:3-dehydroquinate dehydratase-2
MRNRIEVMHGVNLDQLARRDPEHYGLFSLPDLERQVEEWGRELGLVTRFFQTNHEGEFVEHLHGVEGMTDALILNPGSWTHYAWSIHDALEMAGLPAVEVHISDVSNREEWRQRSVIKSLCLETVSGQGADGYRVALKRLHRELSDA